MKKILCGLLMILLLLGILPLYVWAEEVDGGCSVSEDTEAAVMAIEESEAKAITSMVVDPSKGQTAVTIFAMDSWAEPFISIPETFAQEAQIQINGSTDITCRVISGESVTVSGSGIIKPKVTTWYWYSGGFGSTIKYEDMECVNITYDVQYGPSTVRVTKGKNSYDLVIDVCDYSEWYTNEVIDTYISENISDDMSIEEKLDAICRLPASYDYDVNYSSATGMVIAGGGDCWASTSLILEICEKLGIEAKARNGNRDPGSGSGHMNALVIMGDGDYYELEAGYAEEAPRYYHITHRTSLFCYSYTSGGIEIYQYDGDIKQDTVLTIPESIDSQTVVSIGDSCFLYEEMCEVILPDSLVSIGEQAFAGCENLRRIVLPASVQNVGQMVFTDCNALVDLECSESNNTFAARNGILYNKEMTQILSAPACSNIDIPETVTSIGPYAFYYNEQISEITLPKNITRLEEGAFAACGNLIKVVLESVAAIEDYAFFRCSDIDLIFTGEAPTFDGNVFSSTTGTVYYPMGVDSWTKEIQQEYGGDIEWKEYDDISQFDQTLIPPTLEVSNNVKSGKPKLTWNEIEGAESYEVYRSTDNKNWKLLKEVTGTSLTNTSAAAGTKYYYKVRAVAADGSTSEFSAVINRTCDLARPEVSVSNVASSGKIKLSWEKVDGAKSYKVYRSTDNETWSLLKETTGTSLTNTSTTAGKKYYYKVMAIHSTSAANSAYSSVVSRTCDLARPEVSVTNVASSGKIKLSWEKVEGAKSYKVYRSTDNKTWSLLKETTGTSLTNTSTTAGKKYYYKVMAVHSTSAANSAYSSVVSRTCDLARPTAEVSLNSKGKPVVSWNKVSGASKYKVYIYNTSGTLLKTSTTTSLKLTHSTAEKGQVYNYRIMAVHSNSSANSVKSVKVTIKSK